jgi:glycosyltransferase involved in cell wall biosynthesis
VRIWIFNHYATDMYFDGAGRHQSFAKYLIRDGNEVKIFCASTVHNSDININTGDKKSVEKIGKDNVPYIFIKTKNYVGNGRQRIRNMIEYYLKIFGVARQEIKQSGKPDVILASSVHPLALVAGIKIAKKIGVPCVCEVRDLWPESLVEVGIIKRNSLIAKILYLGEKWIYKRADKLIFTMPGGLNYIQDREWDEIQIKKIININNGVDLDEYIANEENVLVEDKDLDEDRTFKAIYTGSIRTANFVKDLVEAAAICQMKGKDKVKFIIYGDGDQRIPLEEAVKNKGLLNIIFKGRVEKRCIPYILSKGDLNIVTGEDSELGRYGVSWNKIFEYMASGKPIVANYNLHDFNLIEQYQFGIGKRFESIDAFAKAIIHMSELSGEEYAVYGRNALKAASDFDYKNLTKQLTVILKQAIKEKR